MNAQREGARGWVALALAISLGLALNCVTFAVLYDAIVSSESGLSENATQVITGAFGGIVGVLGAYLGFNAGLRATPAPTATPAELETEELHDPAELEVAA